MGEMKYTQILVEKREERDHLEDLDVDGRLKLKWVLTLCPACTNCKLCYRETSSFQGNLDFKTYSEMG
jgi:hypothetical protein